jgi:competence protein ComEC
MLALVATAGIWRAPVPDVLISHDARMAAARNPDGRLSVMTTAHDDFTAREWLAADADARTGRDESLSQHVRCDGLGCTVPLRGGGLVALATSAEALADDCARATIVVTQRMAPPGCKAQVIDRDVWRRHGAASLTRAGDRFEITFARPPGYDRPWAKSYVSGADETRASPAMRPAPRDATPRSEDLDAGD